MGQLAETLVWAFRASGILEGILVHVFQWGKLCALCAGLFYFVRKLKEGFWERENELICVRGDLVHWLTIEGPGLARTYVRCRT